MNPTLRLKQLVIFLPLLALALFLAPTTNAQSKTFYWERFDVDITLLENGEMRIVETQTLNFSGAPFTFGYRTIFTGQKGSNDGITNISVRDDQGLEYTESSSRSPGTYTVDDSGDETTINWYFEPAIGSHGYQFAYTVQGGVLVDENGDQISWIAIPDDHPGRVAASTVTIHLPEGVAAQMYTDTTDYLAAGYINEKEGEVTINVSEDGRTATYQLTRSLLQGEELLTRVQFPNGILAIATPDWQTAQQRGDAASLAVLLLSLCLTVAGPLLVLALWYTLGRDPETGVVAPEYITAPPNNLPPALVGTLVDERADMRDIISTIIDLANRGYLTMEEDGRDHVFYRTEKGNEGLRPFEARFLKDVFRGKDKRSLKSLRYKFADKLPNLKKMLYDELVEEGLVPHSPQSVRNNYGFMAFVIFGIAALSFFALPAMLGSLVSTIICPTIPLGLTAVALFVASRHMPAKTRKGAQAAAMWEAFENYLKNIEKYQDLETAGDIFEKYLAYATVFGLERTWIRKFSKVSATPIPRWYGPRHYGHYGYGGAMGQSGGSMPSAPSLEGMSGGVTGGLTNMSKGLTRMLNSSSSVLKSVKPSSSSGSGSSFSGGFSGGGGFSSGGGSAGFG